MEHTAASDAQTSNHSGTIKYELHQAWRWLFRNWRWMLLAVATIAIGVGPNTAVFSVVNGVVLRALPFEESQRLLSVWGVSPESDQERMAVLDVHDLQERCDSFSAWSIYLVSSVEVSYRNISEEMNVISASADTLSTLGLKTILGRGFLPADEEQQSEQVVLLGHGLWQRRFGGDSEVLGKTITVRGVERTIVGVMPQRSGPIPTLDGSAEHFQVWVPFQPWAPWAKRRNIKIVHVLARLAPGVSLSQAQAEVDAAAGQLELEHAASNADRRFRLIPIKKQILGAFEQGLLALLIAVGCVILIACSNVANLLLAIGAGRRREMAIKLALGAPRVHIARTLMFESLLLGICGGALGFLLGAWGVRLLLGMAPPGVPRVDEVMIDGRVLAFSIFVSLLSGLLLGVIPMLQHLRSPLREAIGDRTSNSAGPGSGRLADLLVVGQIALSTILLIGAVLMTRSVADLLAVDSGFDSERILAVLMRVPREVPSNGIFTRQLEEHIEAIPDVEVFGTVGFLPFHHPGYEYRYTTDVTRSAEGGDYASPQPVSPGYLQAMGIPLLEGRWLTYDDMADSSSEAIVVSQTLAESGWPGRSAIGGRLEPDTPVPLSFRVVGVVGDVRHGALDADPKATLYQAKSRRGNFSLYGVIRASGDPARLADEVRSVIQDLDPRVSILEITPLRDLVLASVARPYFVRWLLGTLSALAIALAMVGIYGVMTFRTVRQSREIGIRMAIGASPLLAAKSQLVRGLWLALAGVLIGVLGALFLTRLLSGLLYEISATDPSSILIGCLLLFLATLLACLAPALRAAATEPAVSLRCE